MTLSDYFQYCSQTQDEDPIYVFCPYVVFLRPICEM